MEFSSKNKFEKLVHVIGFIIRIYHDAQTSECQIHNVMFHTVTFDIVVCVFYGDCFSRRKVQCTLDYPRADSRVCRLSVHVCELLMTNDKGGK